MRLWTMVAGASCWVVCASLGGCGGGIGPIGPGDGTGDGTARGSGPGEPGGFVSVNPSPSTSATASSPSDGPGSSTPPGSATSTPPAPTPSVKRVFVTAVQYSGALGGVAGADANCNTAAAAAEIGGTWVAWISTSTVNAIDRVEDVGPWYLTDGVTRVFNNKANLLTIPLAAISLDETGKENGNIAWTGTMGGGVSSGVTCADWTDDDPSYVGDSGSCSIPEDIAQDWGGNALNSDCGLLESLICFEQ